MPPSIKTSQKAPFLNPDLLTCWSGPENIAQVKINDEGSWALLDSGSTINVVTLECVKANSLDGCGSLDQSSRWYSEDKQI